MSQSRRGSAVETVVGTAIGFLVSMAATAVVFPWFGFHPAAQDNLEITAVFTVLSVARGYLVRRLFEKLRGNS
jgi:hypothetical protein